MKIFISDLDNTLIYSYKHNIGNDKILVETKEGKALSFMTARSYKLLEKVKDKMTFIPLTTRSLEQYRRITFSEKWAVESALVANGGILLQNNEVDEIWYNESLNLIENTEGQLALGMQILKNDDNTCFEVRKVDGLFVFTKTENISATRNMLEKNLDLTKVTVFNIGSKIYIFPNKLNKGTALQRMRKLKSPQVIYAAGDSDFDIPMLKEADFSIFPYLLNEFLGNKKNARMVGQKQLLSDAVLEFLLNQE